MIIKRPVSWIVVSVILILCIIFTELTYQSLSENALAPANDESVCVPIIVYHEVKLKMTSYTINPYEFENDLNYLAANHYSAITMNQLIDFVYNGKSLPEKPIILSFDDGYWNNYKYVYPLIKKYNVKIVLSVIAKYTDDYTEYPSNNPDCSHITWDQLNEMIGSGLVDVQNHTYNLHENKKGRIGCMQKKNETDYQYEKILTEDISKCQNEVNANTGIIPNTFTYPYGKSSKNTDLILKKLGFKATLSCNYGVNVINRESSSLFDLKRICRIHGTSIKKALQDGLKTLKYQKTSGEAKEETIHTENAMSACQP